MGYPSINLGQAQSFLLSVQIWFYSGVCSAASLLADQLTRRDTIIPMCTLTQCLVVGILLVSCMVMTGSSSAVNPPVNSPGWMLLAVWLFAWISITDGAFLHLHQPCRVILHSDGWCWWNNEATSLAALQWIVATCNLLINRFCHLFLNQVWIIAKLLLLLISPPNVHNFTP